MADNLTTQTSSLATIPTSTVIGTDEVSIGGVAQHVQRIKLVDGTNGGTDLISGDATNGLDVDVTRLASVDIGALADAAVVTDTTGSLSGKLRGLVKWAFERMPASLGQKAKTASFPVVIASDQDALAVTMTAVPSGGATAANQTTEIARLDTLITHTDGLEGSLSSIDTKLDSQATAANQSTELARLGDVTETAPATDTASSGLNGRLQRIAQRLTSLIALLPISLGQKLKAASFPVVIASDQDTLAISVASLPLPSGAATAANQVTEIAGFATLITQTDGIEGLLTTIDSDTGTLAGAVAGTEFQVDIVGALPAGTNNIGDVDVLTLPALSAGNNNIGDVDIASIAAGDNNIGNVDIASIATGDNNIGNVDVVTLPALPAGTNNIGDVDVLTLPAISGAVTANAGTGTFATKETRASTATLTNVNDTASSTTLLASNANRLGFSVYNDSTVTLYLKYGVTASLTSFTVPILAGGYFEDPWNYTGQVDGIWASDASGAARIMELT